MTSSRRKGSKDSEEEAVEDEELVVAVEHLDSSPVDGTSSVVVVLEAPPTPG